MITHGKLGDRIFHYRARYAQDWITDPESPLVWRLQSKFAGSGEINGSAGSLAFNLKK